MKRFKESSILHTPIRSFIDNFGAVLQQFPFAIFYRRVDDEKRVFAIYHSSRDPKKLRSRKFS
jgi:hypothetical protein